MSGVHASRYNQVYSSKSATSSAGGTGRAESFRPFRIERTVGTSTKFDPQRENESDSSGRQHDQQRHDSNLRCRRLATQNIPYTMSATPTPNTTTLPREVVATSRRLRSKPRASS